MKRLCLLLLDVLLPLGALGENPDMTAEKLAEIAALDAVEDVTGGSLRPGVGGADHGGQKAEVLYVGSAWAIVRMDGVTGYILRRRIHSVKPVDPVHTPPYGVQKSAYIARTADASPCDGPWAGMRRPSSPWRRGRSSACGVCRRAGPSCPAGIPTDISTPGC